MMRLGELALRISEMSLFLAPFLLYFVYRLAVRGRTPSRLALTATMLMLAAFGAGLAWMGTTQRLDPHERYIPAALAPGGGVVTGHGG
jgi:apolipoprotein N-acyltransferase